MVMSGLLLGILVARTVSGLVAGAAGWRVVCWRVVFWMAAGAVLLCAAALRRELPRTRGDSDLSYPALLRSVAAIVRDEPALRRRMVYGMCGMVGFSAFWTALTLLLSDPPYGYGEATIGLFGLLGVAGAVAAQGSGRLVDRGLRHRATGGFLVAVALSWAVLAAAGHSLVALMVGIVLLDLGIQGTHIANLGSIYLVRPDARGRVTTAYMTGNFVIGALGSLAGAAAYGAGGWGAVTCVGAAAALIALGTWVQEQYVRRRGRRTGLGRLEQRRA